MRLTVELQEPGTTTLSPRNYSMISSATSSTSRDRLSPIALAVLRLMTKRYLLGNSTGRAPRLAPSKIAGTLRDDCLAMDVHEYVRGEDHAAPAAPERSDHSFDIGVTVDFGPDLLDPQRLGGTFKGRQVIQSPVSLCHNQL